MKLTNRVPNIWIDAVPINRLNDANDLVITSSSTAFQRIHSSLIKRCLIIPKKKRDYFLNLNKLQCYD